MASKTTSNPSQRALAKAIRSAREQAGYSQEAFARRAGLDRSYYGAIERGVFNVTLQTMLTIVAGLDTSLEQICMQAGL